jgi:hypothetical protein
LLGVEIPYNHPMLADPISHLVPQLSQANPCAAMKFPEIGA